MFCEVCPELAAERGLEHGGWATIVTARGRDRGAGAGHRPDAAAARSQGRTVHQVGLPYHWGRNGLVTGDAANDLLSDRARPERPHPGVQGGHLRHPARAAAPRARPAAAGGRLPGRAGIAEDSDEVDLPDADVRTAATTTSPAADRVLHRHHRLHRLQGLRGRLQGVERASPRTGSRFTGDVLRQHRAPWAPTPGGTSPSSSSERRATATGRLRWLMTSDVCKHCTHAACLDVCPTGALFRTEFGTVVVQQDVCNGCGYCVPACPFGVIDRREDDGRAFKCTLCYDRLGDGLEPACAKACPTDSIQFGAARRAARAGRASGSAHAARGRGRRGAAVRRGPGRRRRRRRRVLPAARRARGLRPAAGPGGRPPATCRRCGGRPRSPPGRCWPRWRASWRVAVAGRR